MSLKVTNISYQQGKKMLLQDISFEIKPGERVGLIGPNGCGKSTLLRLVCGLNKPTRGEITLDDHRLTTYARRELAQRLSFVQQSANTDELVKAEEAVALGRIPWLRAFERWGKKHQYFVDEAMRQVGMTHKRQQNWQTLSGGEQQRLHIARALAQNTPYIVMDEPTNHLDIKQQLVVLTLIEKIERTLLVALHDMNHAMRFDRILAMKNGRIVAEGKPQTLINDAFIAEIFEVPARVIYSADMPPYVQLLH